MAFLHPGELEGYGRDPGHGKPGKWDTVKDLLRPSVDAELQRRGYMPSFQVPSFVPQFDSGTKILGLSPLAFGGVVVGLVGLLAVLKMKKMLPF